MLKWLVRLGLALLLSLLLGLAIGTWLRLRLERPVYYIGAVSPPWLASADRRSDQRSLEVHPDFATEQALERAVLAKTSGDRRDPPGYPEAGRFFHETT